MTQEKTLREVYEDRNAAVLALATLANYLKAEYPEGPFRACWKPDPGNDADADEWAIVYVWLRGGHQVSWHVPKDMVKATGLPRKHVEWDGHTREDKNDRLLAFSEE